MAADNQTKGFWAAFLKDGDCLGSLFLGGVIGNLVASGIEVIGSAALRKLQLERSNLLDHSACFGNHHILRAFALARLESIIALSELTLTQDLEVPYTFW